MKGVNKGNYRVQVFSCKPTGNKIDDSDTGQQIDEVEQFIPDKYGGATELTITISGPMTDANFDLQ
ncbi:MAG TPA: hypothetical protein PLR25_19280 [Planctomycetaceae bacterium]|nr:hypothetical protein [Planctomycetaceae bacterium]